MGQITTKVNDKKQCIGIKTRAQVVKNRMGPPLKTAEFDIRFESGIDDIGSWLALMKEYKMVKQGGSWYTYTDTETGEEIKFMSKEFESKITDDERLKTQIYDRICNAVIMAYKTDDIGIDDIEIGNDDIPNG